MWSDKNIVLKTETKYDSNKEVLKKKATIRCTFVIRNRQLKISWRNNKENRFGEFNTQHTEREAEGNSNIANKFIWMDGWTVTNVNINTVSWKWSNNA